VTGPFRVCSFESRKAAEMRSLIERQNAIATVVPSMREISLGITDEIQTFVDRLQDGAIDVVIFMTGVGAEALAKSIEPDVSLEEFCKLLENRQIVVRGPKPFAVLRKWNVHIDARAEEPNTWEEIVPAVLQVAGSNGRLANQRIAIQEYGLPSTELYDRLGELGAEILPVPVYRWALPEKLDAIEAAIRQTIAGEFDVIMITTAQQLVHVMEIADQIGLQSQWAKAARQCMIASIGPTASSRIREHNLPVDFEPSHPHMGHLIREAIAAAADLLPACRSRN
jgi:uroporphyrinogen-III synthase